MRTWRAGCERVPCIVALGQRVVWCGGTYHDPDNLRQRGFGRRSGVSRAATSSNTSSKNREDRRQETGDRRHATGDRRQETRGRSRSVQYVKFWSNSILTQLVESILMSQLVSQLVWYWNFNTIQYLFN